ncbi:hypothetical protein BsWGS_19928 [Bradybaena similaris]
MSAAKMVADSTQSELADAVDGKKRKKKVKKTGKRVALPEDEDSDLDLKKELKPISAFVKNRPVMIDEMFRAVRGASLQRALPDLLKSIPLEELKLLCLEQLEVMSKKRIRRILAGEESANISSSGTEDDTSDEEAHQPEDLSQHTVKSEAEVEGHPADSTSVHQESIRNAQEGNTQERLELITVKQEPPDFGDYGDGDNEEELEDEAAETYTSGSEDGELVRKEDMNEGCSEAMVKQEPMSEGEEEQDEDAEMGNMEDIEGELMASMQSASEEGVLPSIMMDQMELLELEMRARAIKAMLSSQGDVTTLDDDDEYEVDEDVVDEIVDADCNDESNTGDNTDALDS